MKTTLVEYRLSAPLVHGGFESNRHGNAQPMRRLPLWHEGEVVSLPCVSGNALRGCLRRVLMRDWLLRKLWPGAKPDNWDLIYAICANGGLLSGYDAQVKPERISAVRTALPPLSVLGSAMRDWVLAGRVSVGILWPACDVTVAAGLVPDTGRAIPSLADLECEMSHVRLPDREYQDLEKTGSKPMPQNLEMLPPGVSLHSKIIFRPEATDLERAAFHTGLGMVTQLGGKTAAGLGTVAVQDLPDDRMAYAEWLLCDADQEEARHMLEDITA